MASRSSKLLPTTSRGDLHLSRRRTGAAALMLVVMVSVLVGGCVVVSEDEATSYVVKAEGMGTQLVEAAFDGDVAVEWIRELHEGDIACDSFCMKISTTLTVQVPSTFRSRVGEAARDQGWGIETAPERPDDWLLRLSKEGVDLDAYWKGGELTFRAWSPPYEIDPVRISLSNDCGMHVTVIEWEILTPVWRETYWIEGVRHQVPPSGSLELEYYPRGVSLLVVAEAGWANVFDLSALVDGDAAETFTACHEAQPSEAEALFEQAVSDFGLAVER